MELVYSYTNAVLVLEQKAGNSKVQKQPHTGRGRSLSLYHTLGGQTQALAYSNTTSTWVCSPAREPCGPAGRLHGSETATQEANLLLRYPNPNIYPYQRHNLGQSFGEESSAFTSPPSAHACPQGSGSLHSELAAVPPLPDHAAPRRKQHHVRLDTAVQHLCPPEIYIHVAALYPLF